MPLEWPECVCVCPNMAVCLFFVFIIDVLQNILVVKFAYYPHNFSDQRSSVRPNTLAVVCFFLAFWC